MFAALGLYLSVLPGWLGLEHTIATSPWQIAKSVLISASRCWRSRRIGERPRAATGKESASCPRWDQALYGFRCSPS